MTDYLQEALDGFKQHLAIVEGRAVPGSRSMSEDVTLGIVPVGTVGSPSSSVGSVELNVPEIFESLSEDQLDGLIAKGEELGATPEQFFQIAEELGFDGIEEFFGGSEQLDEVLGTLAAIGAGGILAKKGYDWWKKGAAKRQEKKLAKQKGEQAAAKKGSQVQKSRLKTIQHKEKESARKAEADAASKALKKRRAERGQTLGSKLAKVASGAKNLASRAASSTGSSAKGLLAKVKERAKGTSQADREAARKKLRSSFTKTGKKPLDTSKQKKQIKSFQKAQKKARKAAAKAAEEKATRERAKKAAQRSSFGKGKLGGRTSNSERDARRKMARQAAKRANAKKPSMPPDENIVLLRKRKKK